MSVKRRCHVRSEILALGIKFAVKEEGKEIARAYLYILHNDLHEEPFGLLEDVFVEESYTKCGIGTDLVWRVIKAAREAKCYKLIATSRHEREHVHQWYKKLGFNAYGQEFRMDF